MLLYATSLDIKIIAEYSDIKIFLITQTAFILWAFYKKWFNMGPYGILGGVQTLLSTYSVYMYTDRMLNLYAFMFRIF